MVYSFKKTGKRRPGLLAGLMRCLLAGLALAGGDCRAHDDWLEPETVNAGTKNEQRTLHLRTGEGFKPEEERTLQKDRISRFDLYADQERRRDLLAAGQEGQKPVAKLPPEPGACLAVMDRKEQAHTTEADRFNRHLAEEGQEAVIAQRARLGQTGQEGKEVYTRYLKALVPGQDPLSTLPNTFYKRRVGQKLEILLQNNPARLTTGRRLAVKVLFEGKPLVGAKVFAYRHEGGGAAAVAGGSGGASPAPAPVATPPTVASASPAGSPAPAAPGAVSAVTSAQGLAEFKLDQNGAWIVRLVHLRAGNERKTNPNANGAWESYWGSYSFVARDAPPAAVNREGPGATGGR